MRLGTRRQGIEAAAFIYSSLATNRAVYKWAILSDRNAVQYKGASQNYDRMAFYRLDSEENDYQTCDFVKPKWGNLLSSEIGQRAYDSIVAPAGVLLGHPYNQFFEFGVYARPARATACF